MKACCCCCGDPVALPAPPPRDSPAIPSVGPACAAASPCDDADPACPAAPPVEWLRPAAGPREGKASPPKPFEAGFGGACVPLPFPAPECWCANASPPKLPAAGRAPVLPPMLLPPDVGCSNAAAPPKLLPDDGCETAALPAKPLPDECCANVSPPKLLAEAWGALLLPRPLLEEGCVRVALPPKLLPKEG